MTYIINPLWFYFMDIVKELSCICGFIMIICGIAVIISFLNYFFTTYPGESDIIRLKKLLKLFTSIFIVAAIISIITPSKETMITMMVAKFATYENAAWTLDTVKAAVDYIVNAIANIG